VTVGGTKKEHPGEGCSFKYFFRGLNICYRGDEKRNTCISHLQLLIYRPSVKQIYSNCEESVNFTKIVYKLIFLFQYQC